MSLPLTNLLDLKMLIYWLECILFNQSECRYLESTIRVCRVRRSYKIGQVVWFYPPFISLPLCIT